MSFEQDQPAVQNDWVTVAILVRVRGNRGELAGIDLSARPGRLESLRDVWLFGDGSRREIESVWYHDGKPVFKFAGVDTISDAEPLAGAEVRVPRSQRAPLEPGEFYQADLVGCEVFDPRGASLGRVKQVNEYGGPLLLELEDGLLIPFARSICLEIQPERRRIVVELPEGLKELNRP